MPLKMITVSTVTAMRACFSRNHSIRIFRTRFRFMTTAAVRRRYSESGAANARCSFEPLKRIRLDPVGDPQTGSRHSSSPHQKPGQMAASDKVSDQPRNHFYSGEAPSDGISRSRPPSILRLVHSDGRQPPSNHGDLKASSAGDKSRWRCFRRR